ncbi:ABC transporter ATP-binding protein [Roseococcus pinisoli]|uniref:ABC transporter ATP-binding protein n=1 Tax=Roseococcus pinisoli TaxID=2835040 RepID=A0ABS5QIW7_9PROT|nr:ABC transporter ATP-binding protein [Roseococcus pinisoli]MBS7813627.1 ABC transporter ATP-binding protein [Roseococcus pinisoli]
MGNAPIALEGRALDIAYAGRRVIEGLSVAVPAGGITALIGPNGSGKSTLLRVLARLMRPEGGEVLLDGQAIHRLPTRQVARRIGLLPQGPLAPDGLSVRDLVGYGRFPHQGLLGGVSAEDREAIDRAIALTGLRELQETAVDRLSGGQRQRAWIAMAIAQRTETLLLDEPTTFLDLAHQMEVMNLLERLNREEGRSIVMVLHDINQAARHAGHMVALRDGRILMEGAPEAVVTAGMLRAVFGIEAEIMTDPATGRPWCLPRRPIGRDEE